MSNKDHQLKCDNASFCHALETALNWPNQRAIVILSTECE